jgi:hypothetical protein
MFIVICVTVDSYTFLLLQIFSRRLRKFVAEFYVYNLLLLYGSSVQMSLHKF